MTNSRRSFIKDSCLRGACLCGFGTLLVNKSVGMTTDADQGQQENIFQKWIVEILTNINADIENHKFQELIKKTSTVHYKHINMEALLTPYIGKLDGFIRFIEKEWGWIFRYEDDKKVLIADENKSVCVCPLLDNIKKRKVPALCYCSEGFAEMMFSRINDAPVKVSVISSIQRGDDKCVYRVVLDEQTK